MTTFCTYPEPRPDFAAQARNPITVVLDGVRGNYNIGAIFRLCDAFLVERLIICGEGSQAGPHRVQALLRKRKLVQAAMGTQRWVPWQEEPDAAAVVRAAKAANYWIAVVELTAESVSLAAMHPRYPAALVLGNERSGVSQEVLACADQAIAIPMLGMANSLNVATAGAICTSWCGGWINCSPSARPRRAGSRSRRDAAADREEVPMARYIATVEYDAGQYWIRFPGIEKAGSHAKRPEDIVQHARNFLNGWTKYGAPPASLDDAIDSAKGVAPFEGTKLVIFEWDPP